MTNTTTSSQTTRSTAAARTIAALHSEECFEEIARALEFALFRTYAAPSMSGLLAKTGEFEFRPRKRYDDTELILAETIEHGLVRSEGQRSIARMNAMHGRFRINNSDMLYMLSTFVCEPIRWFERFGRRPMTGTEQRALFLYYCGLGERMGIQNIHSQLDDMMTWNEEWCRSDGIIILSHGLWLPFGQVVWDSELRLLRSVSIDTTTAGTLRGIYYTTVELFCCCCRAWVGQRCGAIAFNFTKCRDRSGEGS
ncbi:oxygenase MpaB family protein [Sulfitobacter sp.]|uniref:oxygenase MpaB family protein n=1 Tax=Sulfitobacter sp. TaxID=1903071 RepID=UPI00356A0EF1